MLFHQRPITLVDYRGQQKLIEAAPRKEPIAALYIGQMHDDISKQRSVGALKQIRAVEVDDEFLLSPYKDIKLIQFKTRKCHLD